MADKDRSGAERVDDGGEIGHIVVDAAPAQRGRPRAHAVVAEIGRMGVVALVCDVRQDVLVPAPRAVPRAVDEDNRMRPCAHSRYARDDVNSHKPHLTRTADTERRISASYYWSRQGSTRRGAGGRARDIRRAVCFVEHGRSSRRPSNLRDMHMQFLVRTKHALSRYPAHIATADGAPCCGVKLSMELWRVEEHDEHAIAYVCYRCRSSHMRERRAARRDVSDAAR
jgi:hypothetical protein